MFLEINLLTRNVKISASFRKAVTVINRVSLVVLILFILLLLLIFYLRLSLVQRSDEISKRFETARAKIESAKPTESLYFAFTSKITAMDKILSDRSNPVLLINEIQKSLPNDTQLVGVNYNKQEISLSVLTGNYENIELLIYSLKNNVSVAVDSITLQNLDRRGNLYESKIVISLAKNLQTPST